MTRFCPLPVAVAALLLACSCSSKTDGGKREKPTPVTAKDGGPTTSGQRDAAVSGIPRPPDDFVAVGIEPCDEYITKQRRCLEEHAPEEIRKPQILGLKSIAAKWAEAAEADRREQLEKTCTHMLESSKNATVSAWGCKW